MARTPVSKMTPVIPDEEPLPSVDTPVHNPPSRLEAFKSLIGDLARPYALITVSTAVAKVIWNEADSGIITAAGVVLGVLYTAKAVEVAFGSKQNANIEKARAESPNYPSAG